MIIWNNDMDTHANLILSHDLAAKADADDFDAIVATLNAPTITHHLGNATAKQTFAALVAAGIDARAVVTTMRADPLAAELLNLLAVSGVDWSDPMTALIMDGLVDTDVMDAIRSLSMRMLSPAEDAGIGSPAADEYRAAWLAFRLSQQVTTQQNETINPAIASGDRVAIVAAWRTAADAVEGI